jgi:hypothetical protein
MTEITLRSCDGSNSWKIDTFRDGRLMLYVMSGDMPVGGCLITIPAGGQLEIAWRDPE